MRVVAWPAESSNPYIAELYRHARAIDPDLEVVGFSPTRSWRSSADIVHVHWPENAWNSPSLARALIKSSLVLLTLALLRSRGASLVWTCHNLEPHETPNPRLEARLRPVFERLVDGVVHLTDSSVDATAGNPRLASKPTTVAPHGRYAPPPAGVPDRAEARRALGLDPDLPVLAAVGMIRPYKQVPELIEAFADMTEPAQLIVAGRVDDPELGRRVRAAASGIDRMVLDDRWLTEDEMTVRIRAADAVVLAYREVHNSGVAILALGHDRPVAVRPEGSLADLGSSVGADWVHELGGPVDGPGLDTLARWAERTRTGSPDLGAFEPTEAAERTVAFYHELAQPT